MDHEAVQKVNMLVSKQNMDTPLITEQEVDSDVNEDPRREKLLDDSLEAFLGHEQDQE